MSIDFKTKPCHWPACQTCAHSQRPSSKLQLPWFSHPGAHGSSIRCLMTLLSSDERASVKSWTVSSGSAGVDQPWAPVAPALSSE